MANQTVKTLLQGSTSSTCMRKAISSILTLLSLTISESSFGKKSMVSKIYHPATIKYQIATIKELTAHDNDYQFSSNILAKNNDAIKLLKNFRRSTRPNLVQLRLEDQNPKKQELSAEELDKIIEIKRPKTVEELDAFIEYQKVAKAPGKIIYTGLEISNKSIQKDSALNIQPFTALGISTLANVDNSSALKIIESRKNKNFKILDKHKDNINSLKISQLNTLETDTSIERISKEENKSPNPGPFVILKDFYKNFYEITKKASEAIVIAPEILERELKNDFSNTKKSQKNKPLKRKTLSKSISKFNRCKFYWTKINKKCK
jgi:hypothetical protein